MIIPTPENSLKPPQELLYKQNLLGSEVREISNLKQTDKYLIKIILFNQKLLYKSEYKSYIKTLTCAMKKKAYWKIYVKCIFQKFLIIDLSVKYSFFVRFALFFKNY